MDKYEYRVKTEEMLNFVHEGKFKEAEAIADVIDWRRVRSVSMLTSVSAIYEQDRNYKVARDLLYIAYDRAKNNKKVLFKLTELALLEGDLDDAIKRYREYANIAGRDSNKFLLEYKISKARGVSILKQIEILNKLKDTEYTEKWGYELASLYSDAGMVEQCIAECDEMFLWFSDGEYVKKALILKKNYTELTEAQNKVLEKDYYDDNEEISDMQKIAGMLLKTEEKNRELEAQRRERVPAFLFGTDKRKSGKDEQDEDADEEDEARDGDDYEDDEETSKYFIEDDKDRANRKDSYDEIEDGDEQSVYKINDDAQDNTNKKQSKKRRVGLGTFIFGNKDKTQEEEEEDIDFYGVSPYEKNTDTKPLGEEIREKIEEEVEKEKSPEEIRSELLGENQGYDKGIEQIDLFGGMQKIDEENTSPSEEEDENIVEEKEEFDAGNIKHEGEYLNDYDDEDVKQIKAPRYDLEVEKEIKRVAALNTDKENRGESAILDKNSIERLKNRREADTIKAENEKLTNRLYDTLDMQAEIMKGIDKIKRENMEFTNEEMINQAPHSLAEPEMTEILPTSVSETKEAEIANNTAKKMAEEVEEIKESDSYKKSEQDDYSEKEKSIVYDEEDDNEGRFIMEERYNLDSRSHVGTDAGLNDTERKIFSYFVPISGMSEQIIKAMDIIKNADRRGTSRQGNAVITGMSGSGKTRLSTGVVKVYQKEYRQKKGPVAVVKAGSLNGKDIGRIFSKVYGGALIIERAGELDKRTMKDLIRTMHSDTGEAIVVLEDSKDSIDALMSLNKKFASVFDARLDIPRFLNDDLATFAHTYAKENGYRIQEMAILALYNRIDSLQRDDHYVTIAEVANIMDEAFENSKTNSLKRTMTNLFKSSGEDKSLTLLMEEDFE